MENRNALIVETELTQASGTAERDAALAMIDRHSPRAKRITLGGDKGFDVTDFVGELRERNVTPHIAVDAHLTKTGKTRKTAIDGRTTRHPGYTISQRIYRTGFALAEWLCRTADRIDPTRVCRPHHRLGRDAFASGPEILRRLLQYPQNAPILEQGYAGFSPGSANRCDQFTRNPGRTSSPLRPCLSFRYTQRGKMRSVQDYLEKAEEFARMAARTQIPALKKRYGDLAECYRLLAEDRKRLIEVGELKPD
jgi:hypothetical protein